MAHRRLSEKRLPFSRVEIDAILESAREKTVVSLAAQAPARGTSAAPKRLTPPTNRGVIEPDIAARLVLEDGQVLEIPARRGWGGSAAFVDWVNFTVHESAFAIRRQGVTDEEVVSECSFVLERIFGFGITACLGRKLNFYERGYVLGEGLGSVGHGGQRDTVLVMLSGEGCTAALPGWEGRLVEFLTKAGGKLTRVDLAFDDYDGGMSVDDLSLLYDYDKFRNGRARPLCEIRGDWKNPSGKGRTIYVGSREGSKLFRGYEKGRQLGDKNSEWVRLECEFKAVQCELPFEMLLKPGAYLAGTYPALGHLDTEQCRIKTTQKSTEIKYLAGVENMRRQCGAWLWTIAGVEGVERAFALLARPIVPKRLAVADCAMYGMPIHKQSRAQLSDDAAMSIPFEVVASKYGDIKDDDAAVAGYLAGVKNRLAYREGVKKNGSQNASAGTRRQGFQRVSRGPVL